jgi:hypothetical protein
MFAIKLDSCAVFHAYLTQRGYMPRQTGLSLGSMLSKEMGQISS